MRLGAEQVGHERDYEGLRDRLIEADRQRRDRPGELDLRCEFPFPGLDFLGRLRCNGCGGGEGQGEQIACRGSGHCFGPPSSREANKDGCTCIPEDTKNTALPHGLVMFCYAWLVLAV